MVVKIEGELRGIRVGKTSKGKEFTQLLVEVQNGAEIPEAVQVFSQEKKNYKKGEKVSLMCNVRAGMGRDNQPNLNIWEITKNV